jgi:hypothetical protein
MGEGEEPAVLGKKGTMIAIVGSWLIGRIAGKERSTGPSFLRASRSAFATERRRQQAISNLKFQMGKGKTQD